ncbi:MAG: HEAT repeat domain-containing protein, partial [Planctomycetes bacterium]|nr:HEAT repeat domain-containing protein [Planctomycetota bacterium]
MIALRSRLLAVCCCVLPTVGKAQDAPSPEAVAYVARAIGEWALDFERERLAPTGTLQSGSGLQPLYVGSSRRAGMVGANDEGRLTHLDMLQKLLFFAEAHPSTELADAVLGIAAARLETSFLDLAALQLREIGHWSLMRMDHQGAWYLVMRAAAGERVPLLAVGREEQEEPDEKGLVVGPGRRVAALRLLGMKGLPVFRSTIEAALRDTDARVRLAAAEALDFQRRPESLKCLVAAIQMERHPVVSQALVRAMHTLLRTQGQKLDPSDRGRALAVSLRQFGLSGWRTDMDLLDLIAAHPHKEAIPTLIHALELAAAPADPLLRAVNKRASPMLRDKAGLLLRGMTGALIAPEDVQGWRAFWAREKDSLVVPEVLPSNRPQTT